MGIGCYLLLNSSNNEEVNVTNNFIGFVALKSIETEDFIIKYVGSWNLLFFIIGALEVNQGVITKGIMIRELLY